MRTRIFIAGPITKGNLAANIEQATEASLRLIKAGYAPFTPHLSVYHSGPPMLAIPNVLPGDTTHAEWLASTLPWVRCAHAVLRLPGESDGAEQEVQVARAFQIPVYHDLGQLLREVPAKQRKATLSGVEVERVENKAKIP